MANKPCLPVSNRRKVRDGDPISFCDIETMDASEYLSRVVQQSNRLPEILIKNEDKKPASSDKFKHHVPIEGSAATLSYLISDRAEVTPAPSEHHVPKHPSEWIDQTLANFSQLREYLEKLYLQNGKAERKQAVPGMKDQPGWHIFCLGLKEARGNAGSYFGDDEEEEDEEEEEGDDDYAETTHESTKDGENSALASDLWREGLPEEGYAPSTSLILQLDQVMIRKVISHLAFYVEEGWCPKSAQRCKWIYSLLARLEKPIHRNDAAVLFGLLRVLTRARADSSSDREGLARLNVLIAIISIYFEQGNVGVMDVK